MLRQLRIENYALIDRLELEFAAGLNVLTGETGSGKSIVVEAVGLLLGDKGSAEMIRSGADRARLAGIFSPADAANPAWRRILDRLAEGGIEIAPGDDLILQRELISAPVAGNGSSSSGALRSRLFVNNQPATASLIRQIATPLAEIHGQHEQQELFLAGAQLDLLDRFAALATARDAVRGLFDSWRGARGQWEKLRTEQQEWLRQLDLWKFQRREIDAAELNPELDHDLDQKLEDEKRLLTHAERIRAKLASAYDALYDAEPSAAAVLSGAERQVSEAAAYDTALSAVSELLLSARAQVEDAALTLRDRLSDLDASPGRLEEIEERLATLDKLKRKYGPTLRDVMRYGLEIAERIAQAEGGEDRIGELEQRMKAAAAAYQKAASELSAARRKAARELQRAIERELAELAMAGTRFEAKLTSEAGEAEWRATGLDQIEFLLAPNAGEPLARLDRIASGGEVSRVMLALETVIASRPAGQPAAKSRHPKPAGGGQPAPDLDVPQHALIFDEVDSGIGGRAAETVGRKLRALGHTRQVLCVTHLPQIASFAHHHFLVEKLEQDGRTVTRVAALSPAGRRDELARMLGGSQITPALRKHAEQLLKTNSG